jgi:hypothetical protein
VSFRLELRPQVLEDLSAAATYYDEREPGRGARFKNAVEQCLEEVLQNPLLPSLREKRRAIDGFTRDLFLIVSFIALLEKPFSSSPSSTRRGMTAIGNNARNVQFLSRPASALRQK